MSSLDRYLFYRGDHGMQIFNIKWSFFTAEAESKFSDDHFRVIGWILNAVRCNVEELDLHFSDGVTLALPSCVFLSQSLRSLLVRLNGVILEADVFCNLNCLKGELCTSHNLAMLQACKFTMYIFYLSESVLSLKI
ncbi:hypothetical protein ACE6H2_001712 [Prunus campanulata]